MPTGDRARQWGRQTDQRKEGGMGGRRVPGALNKPKAGAGGTKLGAGGPERAARRRRGHRGCDAGLTMARRGVASDAWAGGAERAAASLPPLASRRVWLRDSSGRGGGSAGSGSQAAGPRQGGPRRPPLLSAPLPAPPFSARLRAGPPAGTPPAGTPSPCGASPPLLRRPQPSRPALPQPSSSSAPPSSG